MRKLMAIALLTVFGTACSNNERIRSAPIDKAVLDDCPREVMAPGELPARTPFRLPDGRIVVPIEQANARENMLVSGALVFRGAWLQCRSVVIYVEDRDERLGE